MRRWIGLAVLLVGCVEDDLALQALVAAEDPLLEVAERTRLVAVGQARLLAEGPPISEEQRGFHSVEPVLPVVEVGRRVRVIHDGPEARLLLWLDPADLATTVIDGTRGGARPHGAQDEPGVWLPAGREVEVVAADGGWVAVEARTTSLEVAAWVPGFDVGPYWIEQDLPEEPHWTDLDVWLHSGAEILDAPSGDWLASVDSWEVEGEPEAGVPFLGATLLDRAGDHLRVEVVDDGIWVDGWVHEASTSDQVRGGRGGSGCGGMGFGLGGWGIHPALELPAGTPLYAGPDGVWVGETTVERGWGVREERDGWSKIGVPTPWGMAEVWVW